MWITYSCNCSMSYGHPCKFSGYQHRTFDMHMCINKSRQNKMLTYLIGFPDRKNLSICYYNAGRIYFLLQNIDKVMIKFNTLHSVKILRITRKLQLKSKRHHHYILISSPVFLSKKQYLINSKPASSIISKGPYCFFHLPNKETANKPFLKIKCDFTIGCTCSSSFTFKLANKYFICFSISSSNNWVDRIFRCLHNSGRFLL
jgi:hypothetical protein